MPVARKIPASEEAGYNGTSAAGELRVAEQRLESVVHMLLNVAVE